MAPHTDQDLAQRNVLVRSCDTQECILLQFPPDTLVIYYWAKTP